MGRKGVETGNVSPHFSQLFLISIFSSLYPLLNPEFSKLTRIMVQHSITSLSLIDNEGIGEEL